MVYSIKNSETGEVDYIPADSTIVTQPHYDEETGEPLNGQMKVRYRKHGNFHIPKMYLRGTICDEFENVLTNRYQSQSITFKSVSEEEQKPKESTPKKQHYEHEDYIKMDGVDNNILLGYGKNNHRLFLIPTLFCFNFFVVFILAIIEIGLHCWAHHKNKLTMNKQLYFRSPLHCLSSQYCAICRTESDSKYNRIFDALNEQMRLAHRSGALKDITKAMG